MNLNLSFCSYIFNGLFSISSGGSSPVCLCLFYVVFFGFGGRGLCTTYERDFFLNAGVFIFLIQRLCKYSTSQFYVLMFPILPLLGILYRILGVSVVFSLLGSISITAQLSTLLNSYSDSIMGSKQWTLKNSGSFQSLFVAGDIELKSISF